jgi:hypothetical protein
MSKEEDKMMVQTYFNSMLLSNEAWWFTTKDDDVNFHLLQIPNKVKPFSKTQYIYKPSVVSESVALKPGTPVRVVGVTEGADAGSTAVKVMYCGTLSLHQSKDWSMKGECSRLDDKQEGDSPCDCELPIEEMPERMKANTFIVLLSDLGR